MSLLRNKNTPAIVGLTGGIGSGKTTVSNVFQLLGIPIFKADIEAKKLYNNKEFQQELYAAFGSAVFDTAGNPDKKKIADIVFSNKNALNKLNAMIHPKVKDIFEEWLKMQSPKAPYVIQESAIIFEIGWEKLFSKIICVYSPLELSIEHTIKRDSVSEAEVLKRIKNQMDIEEKLRKSDFIIYNNEQQLIIPQVLQLHQKWTMPETEQL